MRPRRTTLRLVEPAHGFGIVKLVAQKKETGMADDWDEMTTDEKTNALRDRMKALYELVAEVAEQTDEILPKMPDLHQMLSTHLERMQARIGDLTARVEALESELRSLRG
jgi:hypothetical protein